MQVLVVSQSVAERARVGSALALDGDVEIVEVDSGEEARRQLVAGEIAPDVLVVDGDLQPRGGFALLYDLNARADFDGRTLPPSVVLTSRDQDHFLVAWARADAALSKPVDPFELARLVRGLHTPARSS